MVHALVRRALQKKTAWDAQTWGVPINQVERAKRAMEDAKSAGTIAYDELVVDTEVAKRLGIVYPNPAMQSNRCHFVFVEQAVKSHALQWDADEEIQVLTLPAEEVLAMAHSGGIMHSLVLNALMLFEAHWEAMKEA